MSRFPRLRRRQDEWSDDHARARTRLAERIDGPLGLAESTWLDEHLAACPSCAAMAAAFEDDRLALRALGDQPPEPPRDLWARTAAAIEAEAGPVRQRLPVGVLSGLAVVALVAGVSLLSGTILFYDDSGSGVKGDDGIELPPGSSVAVGPAVEPTPFAVDAGAVGWIDQGPNAGVHRATIDKVCPVKAVAGCPALETSRDTTALAFTGDTKTIVGSPSHRQAVAIAKSSTGGDDVVVVALPEPAETVAPSAAPAAPSSPPATSPAPVSTASGAPAASAEVDPSVQPSASPLLSPEPSVANSVAIASGIEVVGESAAFSPDGSWFAFTARPADGNGGADVYVWRVGDGEAVKVTDDGTSYFASWSGNEMIASRPSERESEDPGPVSVRIDPATRTEREAGDLWRPIVDPTGRFAIAWDGSLELNEASETWSPARGRLELRRWSDDGPRGGGGSDDSRVVADEAAGDFDARWDEAGEWVAVWVAESSESAVGQLTLYHVDQANGRLERVDGAPVQESALPGFSIGEGRLAWASPPGEGGEGSRIQIAAWSEDGVGVVESGPGDQLVVIR
jgi:Putative zinc-finger/WD40-like Beta Propeller Repeat